MTLLTRHLTGRIAARAGAVAFGKAVATAGGAGLPQASAAGTATLAHNAAAPSPSPASSNQASSCSLYVKGHPVSFPQYGGGTLTMLGDCHGKVAGKVVTNQPSEPGYPQAGAWVQNNSGSFPSCTASFNGSQYTCTTPFVPVPNGYVKVATGNVYNSPAAYIQDSGGNFTYSG